MTKASLLREPLVHFLVLGLLIFAVDRYIRPPTDEKRIIKIDAPLEATLIGIFKEARGREPSDEELVRLSRQWVQNEIYYREALALGLDQGDEMFRSRLILKMREVVMNNLVIPTPTEAELRAFLEANRARYDTPVRYDFVQFLAADIKAGRKPADDLLQTIGDAVPEPYVDLVRSYQGRTRTNIALMFGSAFADELTVSSGPQWRAIQSAQGWHLARVEIVHPATPTSFEEVKDSVRADWELARRKTATVEVLNEMRQRYRLVQAGAKRIDAAKVVDGGLSGDTEQILQPPRKWTEEPGQ